MGDSLNNNLLRRLVSTLFADVESHNHVASCRKELRLANEWNLNCLRRPIARVDDDEINQAAFIYVIRISNNLAFIMRPKKLYQINKAKSTA